MGRALRDLEAERLGDVGQLSCVRRSCRALPDGQPIEVVAEQQVGGVEVALGHSAHGRKDLGGCAEVDIDARMLDGELDHAANDVVGPFRPRAMMPASSRSS